MTEALASLSRWQPALGPEALCVNKARSYPSANPRLMNDTGSLAQA